MNRHRDVKTKYAKFPTFELSVRLMIPFWCFLLLFCSKSPLTPVHGEILPSYNESLTDCSLSNASIRDHSIANSASLNSNFTNGLLLEVNVSVTLNHSALPDHQEAYPEHSLQGTSQLEKAVWTVLGYPALVCDVQTQEDYGRKRLRTHHAYLKLDEFRNLTRQEKVSTAPSRPVNITHRLEPDGTEYNYASASKGAKVVAHNKEANGASNILGKDHDKYLRNPCSVGEKYVVIELSVETLVHVVKIANFEHYSSNFKQFELSGSSIYPTEKWSSLGNFVAANAKQAQSFELPESKLVRYLKLNLLSHYGSEFYCTLSFVEVYGVDGIEQVLEDLIVTSTESAINKISNPNLTTTPALTPEMGSSEEKIDVEIATVVEISNGGVENNVEGKILKNNTPKDAVTRSNIPDPVIEVRQQPNGRLHGDAVLKILMQKVRSLELNLSVLEDYVKEVNKIQGDIVPELEQDLSKFSTLLEKSKREVKDLLEWKESMEKGISDLKSWKAAVISQLDSLVKENGMLRMDVEKVASDQASLEKKELAVLAVSFTFACIAFLKIVSERVYLYLSSSQADGVCRTSGGWMLTLVSSTLTMFVILLCS